MEEPLRDSPPPRTEVVLRPERLDAVFYLQAGERYVIYADKTGKPNEFTVGACVYALRTHGNEPLVNAIRNELRGGPGRIVGRVLRSPGHRGDDAEGLAAVTVTATAESGVYRTTSDGLGWYELRSLPAGVYELVVSKTELVPNHEFNTRFTGRWAPHPKTGVWMPDRSDQGRIDLRTRTCAVRDLAMWPDGRISGRVFEIDGRPADGADVQAFTAKGDDLGWFPTHSAPSGKDGSYEIRGLPAGEYAIGVNGTKRADDSPYPRTMRKDRVRVSHAGAIAGIDLLLPAKRKPANLLVRVVDKDDSPVPKASVRVESPDGGHRWSGTEATDAGGAVQIPVWMRERYRLTASIEVGDDAFVGSAEVAVEAESVPVTIHLQPDTFVP